MPRVDLRNPVGHFTLNDFKTNLLLSFKFLLVKLVELFMAQSIYNGSFYRGLYFKEIHAAYLSNGPDND